MNKSKSRHGSELIDSEKFVYARESTIIPVIKHCRTPESCKFKKCLGFKLHDEINCKEKTLFESIKDAFKGKKYANSIQHNRLQNRSLFSSV